MRGRNKDAYANEKEATQKDPPEFSRSMHEERFEKALLGDAGYTWTVAAGLTFSWFANTIYEQPTAAPVAALEIVAWAGLAARQISPRTQALPHLILLVVWGAVSSAGLPFERALPLIIFLAALVGLAVAAGLVERAVNNRLWWAGLPVGIVPWLIHAPADWVYSAAQSVLILSASGAMLWARRGDNAESLWLWQDTAFFAWIVVGLAPGFAASPGMALAFAMGCLAAMWLFLKAENTRRHFVTVAGVFGALLLLSLRSAEGALWIRLALAYAGFLLLVVAGWRFAHSTHHRWPTSVFRKLPLVFVPRLDQSRDYPLRIDAR